MLHPRIDTPRRYIVSIASTMASLDEAQARIQNAREELADLQSSIISELTGPSDGYLKASFLASVDVIDHSLQKALL